VRFLERDATEAHHLLRGLTNHYLTALSNLPAELKLTDMQTC